MKGYKGLGKRPFKEGGVSGQAVTVRREAEAGLGPGMASVERAASSLRAMPPLQRATAAQRLQQTRGNGFVQRVQAKMRVGPAGDSYEQEADRIAERVMRMPDSQPVQHRAPPEELQLKPVAGQIMRISRQSDPAEPEEEEIQLKGERGGFPVPPAVEARLEARQGGGQPLPAPVRGFMEPRFGADFGGVRLHSDSEAVQLAEGLGARAFTRGQDIYMGRGQDPRTDSGERLIAHELTHVVQQAAIEADGPGPVARQEHNQVDSLRRVPLRAVRRGLIQRRKGKTWRRYPNPNWSSIQKIKNHIMSGEVRDHKPKGLHAYTNHALPNGVRSLKRVGRENAIHTIWWTRNDAVDKGKNRRYAKWSTMFPSNFTESMVAAILTQRVSQDHDTVDLRSLHLPGGDIIIKKPGDTMYPDKSAPGTDETPITDGNNVDYEVVNAA